MNVKHGERFKRLGRRNKMSNLTLDEAIKHCLKIAEQNEAQAEKIGIQFIGSAMDKYATYYRECAVERRQIAEWLTELKQLKAIIAGDDNVNMQKLEMVLAMIRIGSEGAWAKIEREKELEGAKRLLKLAVEDFTVYGALKDLPTEQRVQNPDWQRFNRVFDILDHRWRYTDEALKLLGKDEGNEHK